MDEQTKLFQKFIEEMPSLEKIFDKWEAVLDEKTKSDLYKKIQDTPEVVNLVIERFTKDLEEWEKTEEGEKFVKDSYGLTFDSAPETPPQYIKLDTAPGVPEANLIADVEAEAIHKKVLAEKWSAFFKWAMNKR
jgi:hypothetical protein